jgi:hypothetical protein
MALERGDWATIHQDLVKSGIIKSWAALEPLYVGAHNYDHITIIAFTDMSAYNNLEYQSLFKKHWGDRMQAVLENTGASRDMIGNEIWGVVASVGGNRPATQ